MQQNAVHVFYPKISPNKDGEDYSKHCKHALIKHEPWTGLRNMSHGGDDDDKLKIINLWEDYVKSVISSGGTRPDYLQTEIDRFVLNRQLEINETEDDIVHDHFINDGDDSNDNLENDDWMEGAHNDACVAEQDFDDAEETQVRWDRNHDFSQLQQECMEPLNTQDIETRHKRMLESSRVINRRSVNKSALNRRQEIAHDLIVKALKLNAGESATDGGNDVSRLQLLLAKVEQGKHTH